MQPVQPALCLVVLAVSAVIAPPQPPSPPTPPTPPAAAEPIRAAAIEGPWNGAVQLPGAALKIGVVFTSGEGGLAGTIDIPDQGARGIALEGIAVEGDSVTFRLAGVQGEPTFNGTLAGDAITGTFSQGGMSFPFELKRGELPRPKRPQDPVPPLPYTQEELTATNGDVTLAGTLTRPPGDGPFPAVILITGSGPQNRDEEIFDHRPFAVIADHLTRRGIIVLRYDDRGVGASTGSLAGATTADLAGDAEAWVKVLGERPDVGEIGLLGHSEGGVIAPMIAARNDAVRFIITLAGTGVPGSEVLVEQNRALLLAAAAPKETADAAAEAARELFTAAADGADDQTLHEKIANLVRIQSGGMEPPADVIDAQVTRLREPWLSFFLKHDPAEDLRRVKVPVLALLAGKDAQVVPEQNAPAVEAALKAAGNTDATVRTLPEMNHLFQRARTGSVQEYARIETTIEPEVLEQISGWILERFGPDAGDKGE